MEDQGRSAGTGHRGTAGNPDISCEKYGLGWSPHKMFTSDTRFKIGLYEMEIMYGKLRLYRLCDYAPAVFGICDVDSWLCNLEKGSDVSLALGNCRRGLGQEMG